MSKHALEIRRLNTCTFDEAVQIWNEGFKGYFVDTTLSLDGYVARLHNEGLSPEYSLIAFRAGKPAGFLLNGIRTNGGKKVAWNGGTGVDPEFRGSGRSGVYNLHRASTHGKDLGKFIIVIGNPPCIIPKTTRPPYEMAMGREHLSFLLAMRKSFVRLQYIELIS